MEPLSQSSGSLPMNNNSSNNCRIISDIERQELPQKMAQMGYSERTINAFIELVDEYCNHKGNPNDPIMKNIERYISKTLSDISAS